MKPIINIINIINVINVINEEIQLFEQQRIYNIQDLAALMERLGFDAGSVGHLTNMLQKEFRLRGDEGVVNMYKKMSGVEIHQISKGRYTFEPVSEPVM